MAALGHIYILLWLISAAKSVSHPKIGSEAFCYEEDDPEDCGPSYWEGVCNTGREQSPVDIDFNFADTVFSTKTTFHLSNEYFQQFNRFYAVNNGHSLLVQLDPKEQTSNLILEGANLRSSYVFAQFHFHWGERNSVGSEHTVHGRRYPMELHIVHYKSEYGNFTNAMDQDDREAIAVIAVFFEISSFSPNLEMNSIFEAASASQLMHPGVIMQFNSPLRVSSFLPKKLNFVRYLGSLTTPTCDEKVVWTVFKHPISISELQMNAFRRLRNEKSRPYNNFRHTQPINGRPMTFFKAKGFHQFSPSIDRIWSVQGGLYNMLSQIKRFVSDLILRTIITPSLIFNALSHLILRLLSFMLPVVFIYK